MYYANKAILLGSIGKDAEAVPLTDGKKVIKFSLATQESYKDKNGDWVNDTTWHYIIFFPLKESIENYLTANLKKGRTAFIEGKIENKSYVDKEGNTKYYSQIKAYEVRCDKIKEGEVLEPEVIIDQPDDLPF